VDAVLSDVAPALYPKTAWRTAYASNQGFGACVVVPAAAHPAPTQNHASLQSADCFPGGCQQRFFCWLHMYDTMPPPHATCAGPPICTPLTIAEAQADNDVGSVVSGPSSLFGAGAGGPGIITDSTGGGGGGARVGGGSAPGSTPGTPWRPPHAVSTASFAGNAWQVCCKPLVDDELLARRRPNLHQCCFAVHHVADAHSISHGCMFPSIERGSLISGLLPASTIACTSISCSTVV
jgi:hypothetical protein